MSAPTHAHLRALAGIAGLLVIAGALLGWFEESDAADVTADVRTVRVDDVLGLGAVGWVLLAPFVLAPLLRGDRRARLVALLSIAPGALLVVAAGVLPARRAVSGETVGEVVVARTIGQALSLVGALIALMALGAAWRRAPDWRIPFEWSRTATTP